MNDSGPKQPTRPRDQLARIVIFSAAFVVAMAAFLLVGGSYTAMEKLKLATGYALLIFLFFLSIAVLLDILLGNINLSALLEELSGGASMSRFQLLVFTFVIAFSFFIVVTSGETASFPQIPNSVLILLGVSAGTYGVSKGLQISSGDIGSTSNGNGSSSSDKTGSSSSKAE